LAKAITSSSVLNLEIEGKQSEIKIRDFKKPQKCPKIKAHTSLNKSSHNKSMQIKVKCIFYYLNMYMYINKDVF